MKTSFLQIIKTGLIAGFVSAAANIVLFYVFKAAGIITDDIFIQPAKEGQPGMPLTPLPLVFSSLIPSILASVVLFLLLKYTKNGFKVYTIVSVVLCALSFINPFVGIPGVTTAYAMALNLMHVTVAGSLWYFHKRALATEA